MPYYVQPIAAFLYAALRLYSYILLIHANGHQSHVLWPAALCLHVPSQPHVAVTFFATEPPLRHTEHTYSNALLRHPTNAVYNASDNLSHCRIHATCSHFSQRSHARAASSSFTGQRHVTHRSSSASTSMESCEMTGPLRTSGRAVWWAVSGCRDLGRTSKKSVTFVLKQST